MGTFTRLLAVGVVGVVVLAEERPSAAEENANPFEQAVTANYDGRFSGQDISIRLKPENGKWTGALVFKNKDYAVKGEAKNGGIEGAFSPGESEQSWPFSVKSEGTKIVFCSGAFRQILHRSKLPKLEGVFRSERMRIKFDDKAGKIGGTIIFNGKEYNFSGVGTSCDLEGTFENGGDSFDFVLYSNDNGLVFRTGEFSEVVRPEASPLVGTKFTGQSRWTNSLGMVFVTISGAEVMFCIWDTRVRDYEQYARRNEEVNNSWTNSSFHNEPVSYGPDHPVTMVNWDDAKAFCKWLTRAEQEAGIISRIQSYRLPADSEWSEAAGLKEDATLSPKDKGMAKHDGIFPWGTTWPPPTGAGNYGDKTYVARFSRGKSLVGYDDGYPTTSPVGAFRPNRAGLYDMGGNVWQWCEEWYEEENQTRVLRGAAWHYSDKGSLRTARRIGAPFSRRNYSTGFRVVLTKRY